MDENVPDNPDGVDLDEEYILVDALDLTKPLPYWSDESREAVKNALEAADLIEKNRYQYEKLPSNDHFRLLRLRAGMADDINCHLVTFLIDSEHRPTYRAVSYNWGDDERNSTIQIDGREFVIRKNLKELLRHVRDAKNDCWIWVDAICIDQRSGVERNHQVRLMGKIYSNAKTLAWLGPYDQDIADAFDFMKTTTSFDSRGFRNPLEAYCQSRRLTGLRWLKQGGRPISLERDWKCVTKFCGLANWTRKWIIQEIIIANTVVLQLGHLQLPMTVVEDFFGQLDSKNPYQNASRFVRHRSSLSKYDIDELNRYCQWEKQLGSLKLGSAPAALLARHRLGRRTGKEDPQSLHELLLRYDRYDCKEDSDHIYALFNLIGEHRKHLAVDYTQTPVQRCWTVLRFMQEHDGLPQAEMMHSTNLLIAKLKITKETCVQDLLQEQAGHNTDCMLISLFDRGEAVFEEESTRILERRMQVPALYAMPRWSLRYVQSRWEVQSKSSLHEYVSGTHIVSPHDLTCLKIKGTNTIGLAATRIQSGDHVLQCKDTGIAFIVRRGKMVAAAHHDNMDGEIIGRAILFSTEGLADYDRLSHETTPSLFPSPTQTTPSNWENSERVLGLKFADLLDLAFWADSMGPEASPFSS